MNVNDVTRIKNLISQSEIESAKAEGKIQSIKEEWKKRYGTDDYDEIKKIYSDLLDEKKKTIDRRESLYQKLLDCCDWDSLEEELS